SSRRWRRRNHGLSPGSHRSLGQLSTHGRSGRHDRADNRRLRTFRQAGYAVRSEEHTSELQSLTNLVCRLLLEKKNTNPISMTRIQQKSPLLRRANATGKAASITTPPRTTQISLPSHTVAIALTTTMRTPAHLP